jgi:predicted amidohydrolase
MPELIAVGQMTATSDIDENHATCSRLAQDAKRRGASLLCLPENFAFIGEKLTDARAIAGPLDGELFGRFAALARENGLWISFGGFQEKRPGEERHHNAHVLVDNQGAIQSAYRKVHLFDIEIPDGPVLKESSAVAPGEELIVAKSPVGPLGLSICYDLRFAEQYLKLAKAGAQVLLVPAAFTLTTGKDHWETLLRARAIETQCYVAAAAQTGRHNAKRESWGHASIIDPWGKVLASCGEGDGVAVAEVDLDYLARVRASMPVWEHRRDDIYSKQIDG